MLNLTQQERKVILFLLTVALSGWGIDFFAKRYTSVRALAYFNPDICKIDLNTADKDLLMGVPGIGEKLAMRIIEYRKRYANFGDIEELKNIKGITNYRYEKIKDYFIVRQ